jgi:hypothetical protein
LSVRSFLLKGIVLSTNAYYHIVVRLSFLLKVIVLFTNVDYAIVVRSSFLLKVIVLSTFADYKKARTDKQWGNQHWWTTQ